MMKKRRKATGQSRFLRSSIAPEKSSAQEKETGCDEREHWHCRLRDREAGGLVHPVPAGGQGNSAAGVAEATAEAFSENILTWGGKSH